MTLSTAKKRNELSLQKKYELVQMAEKNPKLGTRKLAEYFNIGKTQACTILKNNVSILESYESNASSEVRRSLKRSRTLVFARTSTLIVQSCVKKQKRLHSTWRSQHPMGG